MKNTILHYSVGALLYYPANQHNIVDSLIKEKFGRHFSLALCLEDTIRDDLVSEAELQLIQTLTTLAELTEKKSFYLPKIFIRLRNPEQMEHLVSLLGSSSSIVTGFILPKVSLENIDKYLTAFHRVNTAAHRFYIMPILEHPVIVNPLSRASILTRLKEKLDHVSEAVLNIRVGGNDLCNVFGFRRRATETIYDLRPIADILSDIITVFGSDYVISGPVFEYYNGQQWENVLSHELSGDRSFGFVGKTVIHPNQIPLVNQAYMVEQTDYNDALSILDWDVECSNLVIGNTARERMNEYKTHYNWAQKILLMAKAYGITEHPVNGTL